MGPPSRRTIAILVFFGAVVAYFCYYGSSNDHFDRLARARQIAMYGDVPFRDFFDPGYFLTLYSSALMIRVFGDNMFGELLLNTLFTGAGTVVVLVLASKASRSTLVGVIAALLVVAAQPRTYDYDKVLFYPLGLYACWKYSGQPTVRSLLFLCITTVIAGMFRYDSGVYIGTAALVGILARHWRDWKIATRRLAGACLAMGLMAAPALIFIQATAGLAEAYEQITDYARQEGERSSLFRPAAFNIDWTRPSFHRVWNSDNAATWLYFVAVALPLVATFVLPRLAGNRQRETIARLMSYSALTGLVAVFILREPVAAHLGGAMSLIVVGGALLADEWRHGLETTRSLPARWLISGGGVTLLLVTVASIGSLMDIPPGKQFEFTRRLDELVKTPIALELLPKGEVQPIVEYLRDCVKDSDRVLVGWFAGEAFSFSGRGFAAGLPVVFGGHWTSLRYQRRSLRILQQQSVPIIVTLREQPMRSYAFLWDFVARHYDLVRDASLSAGPPVQVWVRHDVAPERWYEPFDLPCYAPAFTGSTRTR